MVFSRLLEKIFIVFAIIVIVSLLINHGAIKFDLWDKAVAAFQTAVESEKGQQLIDEAKETAWNVADIFLKKFRDTTRDIKRDYKAEEADYSTADNEDVPLVATSLIEATLNSVIDGDTIIVSTKDRENFKVRLIGIDTPESVHSDSSKNNEYGVMASDYTKALLSSTTTLFLQYDITDKDTYDRDLCYVWLKEDVDTSDTQDIANHMLNGMLLRNGYAYDKMFVPNIKYADIFTQLREEAENTKTGLWQYEEFSELWES